MRDWIYNFGIEYFKWAFWILSNHVYNVNVNYKSHSQNKIISNSLTTYIDYDITINSIKMLC